MANVRFEEMERVEERFIELMVADGFEAWWECEDKWDEYEAIIKAEGYNAEVVEEFFYEMGEDL